MVSQYELERQANIERNRKLLLELDLPSTPLVEPSEPKRQKVPKTVSAKRKIEPETDDAPNATKVQRLASDAPTESSPGPRRSSRNQGKIMDYTSVAKLVAIPARVSNSGNEGPMGRDSGKRTHDPKKYGAIPGIEVGTWWETRQACSLDAIHAPWVAGIHGGNDGAYSVALSGGYDDDVDLGYGFTYTGAGRHRHVNLFALGSSIPGGRDLKGTRTNPKNLRTAPQSSDQTFDNSNNRALQRSAETRKPVRVIRGFKLDSPYAPSEGYRYDGLYTVEKAWIEKGLNKGGFLVCKFSFKRVQGQPALPRRTNEEVEEA